LCFLFLLWVSFGSTHSGGGVRFQADKEEELAPPLFLVAAPVTPQHTKGSPMELHAEAKLKLCFNIIKV